MYFSVSIPIWFGHYGVIIVLLLLILCQHLHYKLPPLRLANGLPTSQMGTGRLKNPRPSPLDGQKSVQSYRRLCACVIRNSASLWDSKLKHETKSPGEISKCWLQVRDDWALSKGFC